MLNHDMIKRDDKGSAGLSAQYPEADGTAAAAPPGKLKCFNYEG
jgi:hypothetical protein